MKTHQITFSDYYSAIGSQVIAGSAFNPYQREGDSAPHTKGYILVIPNANPRYMIYLENASAVVAEEGGMLNHMAIICREIGIPYIRIPKATYIIKDGEWIELRLNPREAQKAEEPEWMNLLTIIPTPPENIKQGWIEVAKQLPKLINKDYELMAEFQGDSMVIQRASLEKFIAEICDNVDILKANLENCDRSCEKNRSLLLTLSTIAIEKNGKGLFPILVKLTGDRDLALSLIRSGYAHYVEVGPQMRWGSWVTDFKVPQFLKDRLKKAKTLIPTEIKSTLQNVSDPHKVELIADVIRTLMQLYERKGA